MNTDVEDLLREGMERFTADFRAPAGLTERISRRRRRRLVLGSMTAGAAVLAAGAAALAVVLVPRIGGDGRPAGAVDAAYVVKNVSDALSAAAPGTIAQMTITTTGAMRPGGTAGTTTAEEWSNGAEWRSVLYSSPGHPVYDEGYSSTSGYTLVSYLTKTWARQPGLGAPVALPAGALPGTPACGSGAHAFPVLFRLGLPGTSTSASSLPTTVAAALRTAVSCGTLTMDGRQTVDGTETIKLTSRAGALLSETIWVSPSTYLPVRVVTRAALANSAIQQTADFTWLQPTPQNLAKLTVPIPAGFRKVPLLQAIAPNLKQIPAGTLPKPPAQPLPLPLPRAFGLPRPGAPILRY